MRSLLFCISICQCAVTILLCRCAVLCLVQGMLVVIHKRLDVFTAGYKRGWSVLCVFVGNLCLVPTVVS